MLHFIWVFTACKSTHLGVSSIQRVNTDSVFGRKVQILISWLYQKPDDLKLHCFQNWYTSAAIFKLQGNSLETDQTATKNQQTTKNHEKFLRGQKDLNVPDLHFLIGPNMDPTQQFLVLNKPLITHSVCYQFMKFMC